MAIVLSGTGIQFTTGPEQQKAASSFVLGFAQTWQNMLSPTVQRATQVTYTNFTGRPIMVFIRMTDSGSNACVFMIDGVNVATTSHNGGNAGAQVQCIIPTGSTYRVDSGSWPMNGWYELR